MPVSVAWLWRAAAVFNTLLIVVFNETRADLQPSKYKIHTVALDIPRKSFRDPMKILRILLSKFYGGVDDVATGATPAALHRGIPLTASARMLCMCTASLTLGHKRGGGGVNVLHNI